MGELELGELGEPFGRLAVAGQQCGPREVAFHGDSVEVAGRGDIQRVEGEVVELSRGRNSYTDGPPTLEAVAPAEPNLALRSDRRDAVENQLFSQPANCKTPRPNRIKDITAK